MTVTVADRSTVAAPGGTGFAYGMRERGRVMNRHVLTTATIAWLLAGLLGCATSTAEYAGMVYYLYGPEGALDVIGSHSTPLDERVLVELERAMALLELGSYRRSNEALSAAALVDEGGVVSGLNPSSEKPPWRPEAHEAVLMTTLRVVNFLALQDLVNAADAADRTVGRIDAVDCPGCEWLFSRVVAAIAYDGVGRWRDGLAVLEPVTATGDAGELVDALRAELLEGASGHQPAGLAPPPVATDRELVVMVLLGRGPFKERAKLQIGPDRSIRWCTYAPRGPQATGAAAVELPDDGAPVPSVALSDVESLAQASLEARAERVQAAGGGSDEGASGDRRHWASLPASLGIIRARVPSEVDRADLVILSPDGDEVDRETLVWPETWTGGRLFVVRRVP